MRKDKLKKIPSSPTFFFWSQCFIIAIETLTKTGSQALETKVKRAALAPTRASTHLPLSLSGLLCGLTVFLLSDTLSTLLSVIFQECSFNCIIWDYPLRNILPPTDKILSTGHSGCFMTAPKSILLGSTLLFPFHASSNSPQA